MSKVKIIKSLRIAFISGALIFVFPLYSFAEIVFSFVGQMDLLNNQMKLMVVDAPLKGSPSLDNYPQFSTLENQPENSLMAYIKKATPCDYRLSLNVQHLKTIFFDLSSHIESFIEIVQPSLGQSQYINGKFRSQYSIIDYKPGEEISGEFEIKADRLYIYSMSLGSLKIQGSLGLVGPYDLDMSVDFKEVGLDPFLDFWIRNKEFEAMGSVSGEIKILGNLEHPFLKGSLEVSRGSIKELNFDKIFLKAQGDYPQLDITKLIIHQSDGVSLELKGPFDLSDHKNFKKQIDSLTMAPLVSHSDSESQWTIKHLDDKDAGSTEIKYRLRKEKNLDFFSEENSPMLGIERKLEF